jgi:hypothetical protein
MSSDMVLEVADRPVCDDDADTAQIVAELVERRSIVRHWLRWWRPSKRREAIEMVEAQDGILFEGLGLDRPSWRLKDEEFAELVARFRRSRGGKWRGALPRIPSEHRSRLHELFVNWSILFGGRWVRMNVAYDRELLRDGEHKLQRS